MPGKARHSKGRHSHQAKKRKSSRRFDLERQEPLATPIKQQAVTPPSRPAPLTSKPAPVSRPVMTQYPYVAVELKRIGVLAGIMVVILVILALVLH